MKKLFHNLFRSGAPSDVAPSSDSVLASEKPSGSRYDVFLSFKNLMPNGAPTRDSQLAQLLFECLSSRGLSVFFSAVSLERLGVSAYKRAIDDALEAAKTLVVVGTSSEHLNSEWVRYEWDGFLNDILSGNKSDGRVFVYMESLLPNKLPRALRQVQAIIHSEGAMEQLYRFIVNASTLTRDETASREPAVPASPRSAPERTGLVHLVSNEISPPHHSDFAVLRFTLTNLSSHPQKVPHLWLRVTERTEINTVRLRKAGALIEEFALAANIAEGDDDLLEDAEAQLVLAPKETNAFKARIFGAEGFSFKARLDVAFINLETGAGSDVQSELFQIIYPIHSVEVIRRRDTR